MSERSTRIQQVLGSEFWTQPQGTFAHPFDLMYQQILQSYREELADRDCSVMDYQLVEVVSSSYVYLRQRMADHEHPIVDRQRREMLKDWTELCVQLKKLWNLEDKEARGDAIAKKLDKIVSPILNNLPDTKENRDLKRALVEGLDQLV